MAFVNLLHPNARHLVLYTPTQGGAFVEVGKNGIWSAARVAQERPDVAFHTGEEGGGCEGRRAGLPAAGGAAPPYARLPTSSKDAGWGQLQ